MTISTQADTVKAKNYTAEMEARMVEVYDPTASQANRDAQVKQLAVELSRTPRSIIAKLSNLKVYVAKEYKTKKGEKPVNKATLVGVVAALCGESEDVFDSLSKANKNVIAIIAQTIMTDENIAQVSCEDYLPCEDYIPYDET